MLVLDEAKALMDRPYVYPAGVGAIADGAMNWSGLCM